MTLRKLSIDNSVKYVPSTNSSPKEISDNHKPKTVSNLRKHNTKDSQRQNIHNKKNFLKDYRKRERFGLNN